MSQPQKIRCGVAWFAAIAFITLALGCGGGGGSSSSRGPSKLFVLDAGNRAIGSQSNPNPGPGTAGVDRIITGPNTGLGTPVGSPSTFDLPSLALDAAADRIYVATQANTLVWDNAGTAEDNTAPSRVITSPGVEFFKLFIDTTTNRLYVAEDVGRVRVYNNASTLSGSVAPTRTITPDIGVPINLQTGIAVDMARNVLYVAAVGDVLAGEWRIIVFDGAATLDTTGGPARAPDRTLLLPGFLISFHLDAVNDRLYVAQDSVVRVYDNASGLNGAVAHNRSFTLGSGQKHIFVDPANNRLYGVGNNLIYIINNVSTADGPGVVGTVVAVQATGALFSAVAVKP